MKNFILLGVGLLVTMVTAQPLENSQITTIEELDLNSSSNRIVNGQPATAGQFPHQVLVVYVNGGRLVVCGGSLICNSWVLTAARCAAGVSNFTLYFGALDMQISNEIGRVEVVTTSAVVHPEYDSGIYRNNVALINLGRSISFTGRIQSIPLKISPVPGDVQLTVSGWGKTSDESGYSRILNYVAVDSISNSECNSILNTNQIVNSMLCCKGRPNHSSCTGDTGGPLIQYTNNNAALVGVVSFVTRSGCAAGGPSGYARVSNYINWIESTIGDSCTISKV